MKKFLVVVFLFTALIFTACQSLSSIFQEPHLSLDSVDIAGISFEGVDLLAHVGVKNPNAFSIPLPKVDWELFINSASFVQGNFSDNKTIGSQGAAVLDVPLSLSYAGLYKTFTSLFETKEAAYDIAMKLRFPIPLLEEKVFNLNFSNVIPIPQLPKILSGSLQIPKFDYNGINLVCDVEMENPNKFPIPFPDLNLNYGVGGVTVLKDSKKPAGNIAAGAKGKTNFGISVAYEDIFKAVSSLRNKTETASLLSLATVFPFSQPEDTKSVFNISQALPIPQKPDVSFQGITRKSLGTTMEFILNYEVDNKNSFPFDIENFLYNFKVNNSLWAQGRLDNPPKVKAGGKTVIPLTISVSAVPVVKEIVDIINRGSTINYDSSGSLNFLSALPGLDLLGFPLDFQGTTRIR